MKLNEMREILCGLGLAALLGFFVLVLHKKLNADRATSFAGYSQSCWQVSDTLYVVTAKGDTLKLDVSRLEGE